MASDHRRRGPRAAILKGIGRVVGLSVVGLCALTAAGCASVSMDLPDDFLQLRTGPHEFKATTPDDARLWVRQFDDPDEGGLEFWAKALWTDCVESRGYTVVGEPETVIASNVAGRVMGFRTTVRGRELGYLIGIWVRPGRITVAEFCARRDGWDELAPLVRDAMTTLEF